MPVRHRKRNPQKSVSKNRDGAPMDRTQQKESTMEAATSETRRGRRLNSKAKMGIAVVAIAFIVVVVPILATTLTNRNSRNSRSTSSTPQSEEQSAPARPERAAPTTGPLLKPSEAPRVSKIGRFKLLKTVPHDPTAFTQGLFFWNDTLYEGTGNYGESNLRIVDLPTGNVLKQVDLKSSLFGEGIAHYPTENGTRIVQITYKEQTGIIWDTDLNRLDRFKYKTTTSEGWGITYADPYGLLVSDGSEWIMVWDPATLTSSKTVKATRRFRVRLLYKGSEQPQILPRVNEMEWDTHSSTLLANVWLQNVLVRIDVDSGFVTNIYDLQELWPDRPRNVDVFNGIAITDKPDVVWVTGKWWPKMYKVRLID